MSVSVKRSRISAEEIPALALQDLFSGLLRYELWWTFAAHDIRQRFRRSVLGPLWLTLSTAIFVAALGFVSSYLFNQEIGRTLPYIAIGIIIWNFLTTVITEGCTAFVAGEGYIRNVPMPTSVHLYRVIARNLIICFYNMSIYIVIFLLFQREFFWTQLLFFAGFALLVINLIWIALMAAIFSTRFRDIPQVIASVVQVIFFLTPVFWSLDSLRQRPAFVTLNPFYHLLEVVRAPLLGAAPSTFSWGMASGLAVIGVPLAILLYRRAYARIPYWV